MKKLFILFILLTLFLSGCNIYNLNFFTIPDDIEFIALIQKLDTPMKIADYMTDDFEYEEHPYIVLTPYELYNIKKGDCTDFATFAQFIAHFHGYETYLAKINYSDYIHGHCITIYNINGYYHFSDNQYYTSTGYSKFRDIIEADARICQIDKTWISYIIYDYDMNIVEKGTNN